MGEARGHRACRRASINWSKGKDAWARSVAAPASQCVAYLVSIDFQIACARRVLAVFFLAALLIAAGGSAEAQDESSSQRSLINEFRIGLLAHHVEPAGTEKGGQDVSVEMLFRRHAFSYGSRLADIVLRPRVHVGASINVNGDTSQLYSGLTWDIPLTERVSLELTFGGSLHDGPHNGDGSAFGCALNFRESASIGFALTQRWRLYGTVAHMSNAGLCERNSGLTSAGVRLGYVFD